MAGAGLGRMSLSVETLMVTLGVIVLGELGVEMAQVPFSEDYKVFEAFRAD